LVNVLRTNLRHGQKDVAVFELGRVFGWNGVAGLEAETEEPRLGLLLAGRAAEHLSRPGRAYDFFDAKGLVEMLSARVGVAARELEPMDAKWDGVLHPGQRAALRAVRPGRPVEYLGLLHPRLVEAWDLKEAPIVAELDPARFDVGAPIRVRPLERFPAV